MSEHSALLHAAERCLAERGHAAAPLQLVSELSDAERRNLVLRCALPESDGIRRGIIIKQARGAYDPAKLDEWDTRRLFCDWAGAEFLSSLGGAHAPAFLGGDRARGFVILEDLGAQRQPLKAALLHGSANDATRALELLLLRLAGMHGETSSKLGRYTTTISQLQGAEPPEQLRYFGQDSAEKLCAFLRELEPLSDELAAYAHAAVAKVEAKGPFAAFIHGDPCLENALLQGADLKLIDFELARPAHALLDALYVLAPFPTCSCAGLLPVELAFQLLELYRRELAKHVTAAADLAVFEAAVLDASDGWLVYRLGWLLREAWQGTEDRDWERGTTRGRILTGLDQYLLVSRRLGGGARLAGHVERLLFELERRWPEAQRLSLFPAFLSR